MNVLEIKDAVRQRDGFRCVECGISDADHVAIMGRGLEVHRRVPGSQYSLEGCVTLCRYCHGPKPKSPWGSGHFNGESHRLNVAGDEYAALEELANRNHRPLIWELRRILHAALEEEGLWPPADAPSED